MATSPTQLSLKKLKDEGYLVAITEHWNPFARIRQDMFGFCDIMAIRDKEILFVQTTSATNVNARIIVENGNVKLWMYHKEKYGS